MLWLATLTDLMPFCGPAGGAAAAVAPTTPRCMTHAPPSTAPLAPTPRHSQPCLTAMAATWRRSGCRKTWRAGCWQRWMPNCCKPMLAPACWTPPQACGSQGEQPRC